MSKEKIVIHCETEEQWIFVNSKLPEEFKLPDNYFKDYNYIYKNINGWGGLIGEAGGVWGEVGGYTILTFNEWLEKRNLQHKNRKEETMEALMLDVLNKTYDNPILRRTTVPLFMSNPGLGKSTIIKEFAKNRGVTMCKITLSQRMPNEVVGMVMPDVVSKKLLVFDSYELDALKDGDILFLDEIFNGTLKQTLDAVLNLLEDRVLPSGKKLADVMIVAASNPQGLINLTPQIKERFIKYDLTFSNKEYQVLLKNRYGMPENISQHLCTLIVKEKFESAWNYLTPRSIEKAINQIGCDLVSSYDDLLLPFLIQKLESPMDISSLGVKKGEEVEYLEILKLFIQHANKNQKSENRVATHISG